MAARKWMLLGAVWLAGVTPVATAQAQYPAYPYNQAYNYQAAPATPQSWNYDPYTSGLGPCPQRSPNSSLSCSQLMPPTYGQPSYWSR
jgi:hypothetical protein